MTRPQRSGRDAFLGVILEGEWDALGDLHALVSALAKQRGIRVVYVQRSNERLWIKMIGGDRS